MKNNVQQTIDDSVELRKDEYLMYVNKWMKKQNLWNPNQRDVMQSLRGLFYLHAVVRIS